MMPSGTANCRGGLPASAPDIMVFQMGGLTTPEKSVSPMLPLCCLPTQTAPTYMGVTPTNQRSFTLLVVPVLPPTCQPGMRARVASPPWFASRSFTTPMIMSRPRYATCGLHTRRFCGRSCEASYRTFPAAVVTRVM